MITTTTTTTTTQATGRDVAEEFRVFALAGLQIGASMMATLSAEQQDSIEGAIRAGARLALEFGPLPAFEHLKLMLVEREGARHALATVALNKGPGPC